MRFISWARDGSRGTAIRSGKDLLNLGSIELLDILRLGPSGTARMQALADQATPLDPDGLTILPVIPNPPKIICVGMNYRDHANENKLPEQTFPTFFARFTSTLVGHQQPILRPFLSDTLDFEGEMAVIIGKPGRHIPVEKALSHIAGFSIFNEASVRAYQVGKGQQWTLGKNFDNTGAFGPELVTADELPPGGSGLQLTTRLNGTVVQSAKTDDLIFDVATLISKFTEATRLEIGDVIVTGTPGGIGFFREPKLYMKPGDVCEVEIERIGVLRNPIQQEARDDISSDMLPETAGASTK